MKTLVYNPACTMGGAVEILKCFLKDVSISKEDYFIVILNDKMKAINFPQYNNINYYYIKSGYLSRMKWLYFKMPYFVQKNKLDSILSLENICNLFYNRCEQYVYLQQSIQFAKIKYLDLKSFIKLKLINGILIKLSCKKSKNVFVQTEWMKKETSIKCNIPLEKIFIVRPSYIKKYQDTNKSEDKVFLKIYKGKSNGNEILISVTSPQKYKRNIILAKAALLLKNKGHDIKIVFTIDPCSKYALEIINLAKKNNARDLFIFTGWLNKNQINKLYGFCDGLVYTSYIETVGIPLLEAMDRGIKVFVPNRPYAEEVCGSYGYYYNFDDEKSLTNCIEKHFFSSPPKSVKIKEDSFMKIINLIKKEG